MQANHKQEAGCRPDARVRLHRRATEVFSEAVQRDPGDRDTFVESACAGDPALRSEVCALLAHDSGKEIARTTAPRRVLEALASLLKLGPTRTQ